MTPEQIAALEELAPLARSAVLERIKDPLASNEQCYVRAGGGASTPASISTSAHRLFKSEKVVKILTLFDVEIFDDAIAGRHEILKDLTDISRATIYDVAEFRNSVDELIDTGTGETFGGQSIIRVKTMEEIQPEHRKLIKSVKQTKYGIEIQLHDAMKARQMLVDAQGLNAPTKVEHSGDIGVRHTSDEEFLAKLQEMGIGNE